MKKLVVAAFTLAWAWPTVSLAQTQAQLYMCKQREIACNSYSYTTKLHCAIGYYGCLHVKPPQQIIVAYCAESFNACAPRYGVDACKKSQQQCVLTRTWQSPNVRDHRS